MRVLVFCLGLSLCLHGGWLMLSKASASMPAVAAISLTDMPKLRISERVKAQSTVAKAAPKTQQPVSPAAVVKPSTAAVASVVNAQPEPMQESPLAAEKIAVTEEVQATQPAHMSAAAVRIESQAPRFRAPPTPPQYPQFARRQQQTGVVVLAVYLDAKGQQERRQIMKSSGYQLLDQAAEKAVSRWQFLPEIHAGLAVPSRIEIPIQFALSNPS